MDNIENDFTEWENAQWLRDALCRNRCKLHFKHSFMYFPNAYNVKTTLNIHNCRQRKTVSAGINKKHNRNFIYSVMIMPTWALIIHQDDSDLLYEDHDDQEAGKMYNNFLCCLKNHEFTYQIFFEYRIVRPEVDLHSSKDG